MKPFKKSYTYKVIQLLYGELSHKENSLSQKAMRIFARTPLRTSIFTLINFFKKNKKNKVYDENIFVNNISVEKSIIDLNSNGICKDFKIKPRLIEEIQKTANQKKFKVNRTNDYIKITEKKKNDGIYIARLINPHNDIKQINKIIYNKDIIDIVSSYLKCEPIFLSSQIWWSFPYYDKGKNYCNPPNNEYGFHYDVDDFKFLKLFIYLTDVSDSNGPHIYIKNSGNKSLKEYLDRRITDEEAQLKYADKIIKITGKSGDCFIEDTSFYHKGSNPQNDNGRCILQVIYVSNAW